MGNFVARIVGSLPDAITAAFYLTAWVMPSLLGPVWVKDLMLTMIIEFIVMHSGLFYLKIATGTQSKAKKVGLLLGCTIFYLLFIIGFSVGFKSTWPLFAFGWLFLSRFIGLWTQRSAQATAQMEKGYAASVVFYLGGTFATILLPLPALGLTSAFIASMQLSGKGLWIDHPQTAIVFGLLYFGAQAWFKFHVASASKEAAARGA